MQSPAAELKDLPTGRLFFVGMDSDGCVFDSMEVKHKECFGPAFIRHFDLGPAAGDAREIWEFVNLYSRSRGVNRFDALLRSLELLERRSERARFGSTGAVLRALRRWVEGAAVRAAPNLAEELARCPSRELERVYRWSLDADRAIEGIVPRIAPFYGARRALAELAPKADIGVVSQTPGAALEREWAEYGLRDTVRFLAGQEMGTKQEQLGAAAGGKYGEGRLLVIGDAPGDLEAAQDCGMLFFPILPGAEEESWERFTEEGLERFLHESFAGAYQRRLIEEFSRRLPERAPWEECA